MLGLKNAACRHLHHRSIAALVCGHLASFLFGMIGILLLDANGLSVSGCVQHPKMDLLIPTRLFSKWCACRRLVGVGGFEVAYVRLEVGAMLR